MNASTLNIHREQATTVQNGWVCLPIILLLLLGSIALFIYSIVSGIRHLGHPYWVWFVTSGLLMPFSGLLMAGFFTLQPNEARVLLLFGQYMGTVRQSGFHWGNPFYSNGLRLRLAATKVGAGIAMKSASRNKISLRARNLNSDKLKVNDKLGN